MYDATRVPFPPPPRRPFWTRPKVGGIGVVVGLVLGFAVAAVPTESEPAFVAAVPPPVVQQGATEDEVQAAVDAAVSDAADGFEEEIAVQQDELAALRQEAAADLRTVRRQAKAAQAAAVEDAVARALADVPEPVVEEVPVEAPAPDPEPATDPQFEYCSDATAAGYGNYVAGQDPEYDWYDDADGDGVVCET